MIRKYSYCYSLKIKLVGGAESEYSHTVKVALWLQPLHHRSTQQAKYSLSAPETEYLITGNTYIFFDLKMRVH